MVIVPTLQFRCNSIIAYNSFEGVTHSCNKFNLVKSEKRAYSGTVTKGAQKRIRKAVTLLVQSTPEKRIYNEVSRKHQQFSLSFITLTISAKTKMVTAKEAHKKLLEPLLLWLKRKHGLKNYIWKAELQKRGQIHYHLTSNLFITHDKLREKWNELQRKAGYLDDYFNTKGHYNANSTDIHSVYKVKNIEAYLIKYLSKSGTDQDKTIGKIWDCSVNLKKCPYFTTVSDNSYQQRINEAIDLKEIIPIFLDNCTVFSFKNLKPTYFLSDEDNINYKTHCSLVNTC